MSKPLTESAPRPPADPAATGPGRLRLTPRSVSWLGILIDGLLAASKIVAGLLLYSQAILADGLHAASDLVTDVVVLASVQAGIRPPDHGHPYGHRRYETLGGMFVGLVLFVAAVYILYEAATTLREPGGELRAGLPFLLALASIPIKELLFRVTRHVARRDRSNALRANAWHHRTDVFTSVAAAAGLGAAYFGGPAWSFVDPVTAAVLASFLVIVALRIVRDSAAELVDAAPDPRTLEEIKRTVADTEGVADFHAVRARRSGGQVVMDIHVLVNPQLTVASGHRIASEVERRILDGDCHVAQVTVHIEPATHSVPTPPDHAVPPING